MTAEGISFFNGDNLTDIITAHDQGNLILVITGQSDGAFQIDRRFEVGSSPRSIIPADFDGDGAMDLAVANAGSDDLSVILNHSF